ncbi:YqeB family protein [Streptomyces decoyicus]
MVGFVVQHEELVIRLTDDCVVLTRKGRNQTFRHDAIATACRDRPSAPARPRRRGTRARGVR